MPRTVTIASLAAVIVLALALGACGDKGTSAAAKNAYVAHVNTAQLSFAQTVTKLAQTGSAGEYRRVFDSFRLAIDRVVATLRAIAVPDEVRGPHARLVAAMSGFGKDITTVKNAMRGATPQVFADVRRKLSAATITANAKISAAISAINDKLHAK